MIRLLSNIIHFNDILIIGVYRNLDSTSYFVLHVRKKKSRLEVVSSSEFHSIGELIQFKDKPILLLIDGKGVLNKKVDASNESDVNWQKSINYQTIHYTSFTQEPVSHISFIRKGQGEEVLSEFQQNGFKLLDFYIGPVPAVLLRAGLKHAVVKSNESALVFSGEILQEILKSDDTTATEYSIGSTVLSGYHLPLYGIAVDHFLASPILSKSESAIINREEALYQEAFKKLGIAMLAGFFILLLCSYIVTQYYGTKNVELMQQNVFSQQSYDDVMKLEEKRDQKIKILNETGLLSDRFLSYYSYELTGAVPAGIQFNQLNIFPVGPEIKDSKKVVLNSGYILVTGTADDEKQFDGWITNVKTAVWVSRLEILSFSKDKKNVSQFEINITVK